MKYILSSLLTTLTVGMLVISPTTYASTPDGQTPANEDVCDPLKADGITKGLYGLCVAFCEAQDIAAIDMPLTETQLEALEQAAPSGRILANYNKKKQETDPSMPCIKVEEPCPCWSSAELAAVDGTLPSGGSTAEFNCTGGLMSDDRAIVEKGPGEYSLNAFDWHRGNIENEVCFYFNNQSGTTITRILSVDEGTLTHEQAATCLAQVVARCEELGI